MEPSSSFELFVRAVTSGSRHIIVETGPWILVWLLIASPFAWLLWRFRKGTVGIIGTVARILAFTAVIAGICAGVHGLLAIGEAFGSAIDKDRARVFAVLTAMFPLTGFWIVFRKPRGEKLAEPDGEHS